MFSDETTFQLFRNTGTRIMTRKNKQNFCLGWALEKKSNKSFLFSGKNEWPVYVEMLKKKHFPEIRSTFGNRWKFQHDNDPKHTSRVAKAFFLCVIF